MEQTDKMTEQVFSLFDAGEEAIGFLCEQGLEGHAYLLRDLRDLCASLAGAVEECRISRQNKLKEIGLNAPLTVDSVCRALEEGAVERAYMEFRCTFLPLFFFWRRYLTFFLVYAADEESLSDWYARERERFREIRAAQPLPEEDREVRFDFSVVVLFYGSRKMTEECLDAIAAHTRGHSYELITFDNGSDPETSAWCRSLPHEKKIYYPHNLGSSAALNLILTMAPWYAEGKYLLFISNDVVVTPRYDEILFRCVESDPRIALAVPVCNSASNLQAIPVPYPPGDGKAMLRFAENYNHSDPRKWVDRARLFDILAVYRFQALRQVYLALDPLFCYDMFADDDHSCAMRRMGFRQVLCKDVFVHHYGSATLGANQFQVMDLGREQFYRKHGVDAWDSLGIDLCAALGSFSVQGARPPRILALDPLFGESVLAFCGRLRECGFAEPEVDALVEDPRYLEDAEALFHQAALLRDQERLSGEPYDFAIVGCVLERCRDLGAVVDAAVRHLSPQGLLLAQRGNPCGFAAVRAALEGAEPVNEFFLHDPLEPPCLPVLDGHTQKALMERAGLTALWSIRVTEGSWEKPTAQLLDRLGVQRRKQAEALLLSSGELTIWGKKDRETGGGPVGRHD